MLIQTMEVTAQANIFLHAQHITNDGDVFLGRQVLANSVRTDWEGILIIQIKYIGFVSGVISVFEN